MICEPNPWETAVGATWRFKAPLGDAVNCKLAWARGDFVLKKKHWKAEGKTKPCLSFQQKHFWMNSSRDSTIDMRDYFLFNTCPIKEGPFSREVKEINETPRSRPRNECFLSIHSSVTLSAASKIKWKTVWIPWRMVCVIGSHYLPFYKVALIEKIEGVLF